MNEQIRELAKEALDHAEKNQSAEAQQHWFKLYNEKFAELIIRECIDCARGAGLADDVAVRNSLGFNDGISEAVTHMKKHFGVEE